MKSRKRHKLSNNKTKVLVHVMEVPFYSGLIASHVTRAAAYYNLISSHCSDATAYCDINDTVA